jgi:hypothetical protein
MLRLGARADWPSVDEDYSAGHWLDNWCDAVRSGPAAEYHADESALLSGEDFAAWLAALLRVTMAELDRHRADFDSK